MGDLVLLASYPKSGNTWLRAVLTGFIDTGAGNLDINRLMRGITSDRGMFDVTMKVESSDLTAEEIDRLRPRFYRELAARARTTVYLKAHDAYTFSADGEPLFGSDCIRGVVYIARNPLDVAVSFAHHRGKSIDSTIESMADPKFGIARSVGSLHLQLEQRLTSWSGHVLSWLDQRSIPTHLMRYEDMHRDPVGTFGSCLEFLRIEADRGELERAISLSSFSALRAQEQASGFRERSTEAPAFFRQGRSGGWRDTLSHSQVLRVVKDHGDVMKLLGYIDKQGSLE